MKKLFGGLCTLLVCLMFLSCGSSNPASKMKSIAEDISNNRNEWVDENQWYSALEEATQCYIEFSKSNPDKETFDSFMDAYAAINDAMIGIDNNEARNARTRAQKKIAQNKDIQQQLKEAYEKMDELEESFK